jgi:hypothetical protein
MMATLKGPLETAAVACNTSSEGVSIISSVFTYPRWRSVGIPGHRDGLYRHGLRRLQRHGGAAPAPARQAPAPPPVVGVHRLAQRPPLHYLQGTLRNGREAAARAPVRHGLGTGSLAARRNDHEKGLQ